MFQVGEALCTPVKYNFMDFMEFDVRVVYTESYHTNYIVLTTNETLHKAQVKFYQISCQGLYILFVVLFVMGSIYKKCNER
jgi:hypothetical protein